METREKRFHEKQKKIVAKEKQEKRTKEIKIFLKILFGFAVFCFFFFSYILMIGTKSLIVEEKKLTFSSLPSSFHGLKIIYFSDLHYPSTFLEKEIQNLKQEIAIRKPDLIFFGGDLFATPTKVKEKDKKMIQSFLEELDATLGKYAVLGETDGEIAKNVLEAAGFQVLLDSYDLIYQKENTPILLVGIDSREKVANYEQAFSYFQQDNANQEIFTIALFHHPDTMSAIQNTKEVDLAFAAHSHRGQVRLPYLPPFQPKKRASTYYDSFYEIGKTKFYISAGLGTSGFHYRYFVRPTLSFFRLATS